MALIEARDLRSAKDVIQNVKRTRAYFAGLHAPPEGKTAWQITAEGLSRDIQIIKAERDQYRALYDEAKRVNALLSPLAAAEELHLPTIEKIMKACCIYYDVPRMFVVADRRTALVVRARFVAMFLVRELTPHSMPAIGRKFGGRHHTTVMSALKHIERNRHKDDGKLDKEINELRSQLVRVK